MSEPKIEYTEAGYSYYWRDGRLFFHDGEGAILTPTDIQTLFSPEPTHYAVFDEKDEMITAYSIERYPDAESMCRTEISEIIEQIPQAKDWTVKGVTVHE